METQQYAEALGLSKDASAKEVADEMARVKARNAELEALAQAEAEAKHSALSEGAIKQGKILEKDRAFYAGFAADQLEGLIERLPGKPDPIAELDRNDTEVSEITKGKSLTWWQKNDPQGLATLEEADAAEFAAVLASVGKPGDEQCTPPLNAFRSPSALPVGSKW